MTGILNLILGGVGVVKDAYFNLVSLLLPGNGTNGAQNNTFLDSSTNNFTITRNGNTTQGTFSPFSQTGWGNYLPTTSERLTTASSSSDFSFGTGDFTIEGFVNLSAASSCMVFQMSTASTGYNASSSNSVCLYVGASGNAGKLEIYANNTNYASTNVMISSSDIGKWYHFAIVRSSGSTTVYWNGSAVAGLTSISDSANYTMTYCVIGTIYNNTYSLQGYLSNFRVLKGTAQYSGASITVPTSPFATGTTNQVLLICQSNRFIDSNTATTAKTITVTGSPSVVAFSPFAPTAAYTTAAVGGSGYFDGNGDELNVGSNAAFGFGTSAYTVELWVYLTAAVSATHAPCFVFNDATGGFGFYNENGGNQLQIATRAGSVVLASTTTLTANTWNHIVAVRSGTGTNQTAIFVNGNRVANGTDATNYTVTGPLKIGGLSLSNFYVNGYLSNVRIVKGSAVYDPTSSSITVPTAPLTAITNTSLLLNFTNAGITDATAKNDLETVGNAQISTSVSKFGGGSMSFNGTTGYLKSPASPAFNCGTGNWTIEGWVYISSYSTNFPLIIGNNNGTFSAGALGFTAQNAGNNKFSLAAYDVNSGAAALVASVTNSTGVWYYVALVRNGTSLIMYRDGTSVASTTISAGVTFDWGKSGLLVAGASWDGAASYFNGYIDDLRLTKYARYVTGTGANAGQMVFNGTNTLALPTAPFPVQ